MSSILTNDHPRVRELREAAAVFFAEHLGAPVYVRIQDGWEARAVPSSGSPQGIRVLLWIPPRAPLDGRDADWDSDRDS